jgi:hypothetical protein
MVVQTGRDPLQQAAQAAASIARAQVRPEAPFQYPSRCRAGASPESSLPAPSCMWLLSFFGPSFSLLTDGSWMCASSSTA